MQQGGETQEHRPVMLEQTLRMLAPRAGGRYADVTLGRGGHAEATLEASAPDGWLLGLDRDPEALEQARRRLQPYGERVTLVHARFGELARVLADLGIERVDGLVADLGLSSPQLEEAERGFSIQRSGPLDMRMDPTQGETAAELIARLGERELADVLREFGEERRARAVARSIHRSLEHGELETTGDLRRAVTRAVGPKRGRIDPATRSFQALRIAVNRELEELDTLLRDFPEVLEDEGVAVLISFHSLEDRRVKWSFRNDPRLTPITKKPLVPDEDETRVNRRARSAKLRAARRNTREVSA
jgi:16S rRNA (cytosine1402-N4)-methyltransferase